MRSMTKRTATAVLAIGVVAAGCSGGDDTSTSADGDEAAVALPEPAAGPVPELAVSAEAAASSPLPEVAVRQLNGDGGWVQFKNELPSDLPLLVWFWAPS
jgi:hypothetical protein